MAKIQWFPGHMHKARIQMAEILPRVDLVIEVLDARIPYSSENPMLAELRGDKTVLKLLNKSDLADPDVTKTWMAHFDSLDGIQSRKVTTEEPKKVWQLGDVFRQIVARATGRNKDMVAMICGVPNVGKSSLINLLAGRKAFRTGNEPGVTRGQQRIHLDNGVVLLDTPGLLWPNVANENSGYRLATVGSIKDTAMEYEDVALFATDFLLQAYPQRLIDRYGLEPLPEAALPTMEAIARRRGCVSKRAMIDYERVARILLNDLRNGKLGPLTLETPRMMEAEKIAVQTLLEEQQTKKRTRDAERKARFQARQHRGQGTRRSKRP